MATGATYSKIDDNETTITQEDGVEEKEEKGEKNKQDDQVVDLTPQDGGGDDDGAEVDPVEEKARSQGWRPQEEWDGDPSEWVDAKEFVFRGELMDRIRQQSSKINDFAKENKEIKDALRTLGEHNKKIAEQEYKKALSDLKKQKAEALSEQDHESVVDIDDRIEELKKSKQELEDESSFDVDGDKNTEKGKENEEPQLPEPVSNWLQNNSNKWYHDDPVMRGAADNVYLQHLQFNPEDHVGALKKVDETIRAYFPEKFGTTKANRSGAPVTEVGNRNGANKNSGKNSKKASSKDLSDEQKQVAQTFVKQGVFKDVQEYVDQLVELGEL